jgi:hypothetical protein
MAFIGAQAQFLSNDVLAKWLIEDFPFRIQLSSVFPFYPIAGHELRYTNTPALVPGVAIDHCEPIPEDTKLPGTPPQRIAKFAELATQFRISYNAADIFSSNVNDQVAVQMALAIRELLYRFWTMFESGNSAVNPKEFDGLNTIVHPSKVIDLLCSPLTLEALDAALDLIRSNDGRCRVIFTSGIGKQAILAAHYVRGVEPQFETVEVPCATGGTKLEQVLKYDGALVYVNDLNQVFPCTPPPPGVVAATAGCCGPGEEKEGHSHTVAKTLSTQEVMEKTASLLTSNLGTNIWFFVMGQNNLHGITPASLGPSLFDVRSTILPDESCLVYHITMPTGIALGSACALSVLKNVTIPVVPPPPVCKEAAFEADCFNGYDNINHGTWVPNALVTFDGDKMILSSGTAPAQCCQPLLANPPISDATYAVRFTIPTQFSEFDALQWTIIGNNGSGVTLGIKNTGFQIQRSDGVNTRLWAGLFAWVPGQTYDFQMNFDAAGMVTAFVDCNPIALEFQEFPGGLGTAFQKCFIAFLTANAVSWSIDFEIVDIPVQPCGTIWCCPNPPPATTEDDKLT